ncbi:MAG: S8 family serine peptidase [Methanomicrobiales archaeon]|jgi:thermitase|nr:S8 family serine peptidase [Methanomicrobiales archaeon]
MELGDGILDEKQIAQRIVRVFFLCHIWFIFVLLCASGAGADTSLSHLPEYHLILQFYSGEEMLAALDLLAQDPYNQTTTVDLISCDLAFIAITAHSASPHQVRDPYFLLPGLKQISDDEIRWPETVSTEEAFEASVNDPLFSQQWGLQMMQVPQTWEFAQATYLPRLNLTVAVVDTGVDFTHPDLLGTYHAASYDWVHGTPRIIDTNGHGTHLAGIIAATTNNFMGMSGIAPVLILSETVYKEGVGIRASYSAMGIYHAAQAGAEVIVLGYGGKKYSDIEAQAISYAKKQGSLIIASAGNDQSNASHYPSDLSDVICVGSISQTKSTSIFSNYGIFIELVAPGQNIYGPEPGLKYSKKTGTSQAAAGVAGVAALIWSLDSNLAAKDVRTILTETAENFGKEGRDIYFGWGYPNSLRAAELVLSQVLQETADESSD